MSNANPLEAECPHCGDKFSSMNRLFNHHRTKHGSATAPIEAQEAPDYLSPDDMTVAQLADWFDNHGESNLAILARTVAKEMEKTMDDIAICPGCNTMKHPWNDKGECITCARDRVLAPHPEVTQGDELEEILAMCSFQGPFELMVETLRAYLSTTATRMAVEARIDELQLIVSAKPGTSWVFVHRAATERLAALQAQLKGLEGK